MSHKYLVLGLLAEQPMSGYDIRKYVEDVLHPATNASYGTLYPVLHRLHDEGAVDVREVDQDNRPSKKVYSLTDKGQALLDAWLHEPPDDDKVRREFLLKLYFARNLPEDELLTLLEQRRDTTRALLDSLHAERDELDETHQRWIVDYALSLCQAEIDWLQRVKETL